jgi:hypothetical protein
MKTVDTYPIGTEVWYFDPSLQGECPIIKSIVMGSFMNKQEGELFYFLLGGQIEGYAVWDSEQKAREMRDVFFLYRDELIKANEENKVRFNKMRDGHVFEEYQIDNLPQEEKCDGEPVHSANDA